MAIDAKTFWEAVHNRMRNSKRRVGQSVFDVVFFNDHELAKSLTGTEVDCYYDDSKIPLFMDAIKDHLV